MESRHINAVGIWLYSKSTKRYLYLLRNDPKHPGAWGLPGGKANRKESLSDTIKRECTEEAHPESRAHKKEKDYTDQNHRTRATT